LDSYVESKFRITKDSEAPKNHLTPTIDLDEKQQFEHLQKLQIKLQARKALTKHVLQK